MTAPRSTFRMTDERARLFEQAKDILRRDDADDPPNADVIDAALTHLVESHRLMDTARQKYPPHEIQEMMNTSVLRLHYRTAIDSPWR